MLLKYLQSSPFTIYITNTRDSIMRNQNQLMAFGSHDSVPQHLLFDAAQWKFVSMSTFRNQLCPLG